MISIIEILTLSFPGRNGWIVDGDLITAGDGGAIPSMEEIEAQREAAQAILDALVAAREARATERAALRADWDALPGFIRGPFREKFEIANTLLDEGDDEAAAALIEYADHPASYTQDQIDVFEATKAAMKSGIENLTPK